MRRNYFITINDRTHEVALLERTRNSVTFSVNGETISAAIDAPLVLTQSAASAGTVAPYGGRQREEVTAPPGSVVAPMPGIVLKVLCSNGERVKRDQPLLVIEAMKMENTIAAPLSGTVARVVAQTGEEVKKGQILIELLADA